MSRFRKVAFVFQKIHIADLLYLVHIDTGLLVITSRLALTFNLKIHIRKAQTCSVPK